MKYHGFYIKFSRNENMKREDKNGNQIDCKGYMIELFCDESGLNKIDLFSCAVGFEMLNDTLSEAEQFVKDVIDSNEKEYQKIINEDN